MRRAEAGSLMGCKGPRRRTRVWGRTLVGYKGMVRPTRWIGGTSSSWGGEDRALGIAAIFLTQEDKMCVEVVGESRGTGQGISGGLKEKYDEVCRN